MNERERGENWHPSAAVLRLNQWPKLPLCDSDEIADGSPSPITALREMFTSTLETSTYIHFQFGLFCECAFVVFEICCYNCLILFLTE
ncbi:hypothetical protein L1987_04309 [Smallanthus sonchifolius]|uniref:Uncharacterized protein n=1 Tax=Smallanthus sonchifolius TaxID=185202 RepID=A0ACB9KD25_9ASTR|nr:hypothetical protein L1987_04309 [Smallanthus sonchifolius]